MLQTFPLYLLVTGKFTEGDKKAFFLDILGHTNPRDRGSLE